jgi:hypothetical protein
VRSLCTRYRIGDSAVITRMPQLRTRFFGMWWFAAAMMPDAASYHPFYFAEFEILPNGNIIIANWQGRGSGNGNAGRQVFEFNPAGDVTWFYQQDPKLFSSINGVMVLDGKDPQYLHVQETSSDSTWQPVRP